MYSQTAKRVPSAMAACAGAVGPAECGRGPESCCGGFKAGLCCTLFAIFLRFAEGDVGCVLQSLRILTGDLVGSCSVVPIFSTICRHPAQSCGFGIRLLRQLGDRNQEVQVVCTATEAALMQGAGRQAGETDVCAKNLSSEGPRDSHARTRQIVATRVASASRRGSRPHLFKKTQKD